MGLDIGDALEQGLSRATERNALPLLAAFALLGLVDAAIGQTLLDNLLRRFAEVLRDQGELDAAGQLEALFGQGPLVLPNVPTSALLVAGLVTFVVREAVRVISDRTFVSDETERLHEPGRNIALATLNSVVASIVIAVLLVVGVVLLVLPALFVAVVFFFTRQEIAVEDKSFVDALSDSVSLTKGSRLEIFALAAVLFVLSFVVTLVGDAFGALGALAGDVAGVVLGAAVAVYASAVAAQAYRQLREERERDGEATGTETGGDEWDDPDGVDV